MSKKKDKIYRENAISDKKSARKVKKSHGCRNCLISLLVFVVVAAAGIYGGAYWAWGRYLQPKTGITLNQAFGLLGSLYKADEDKIITNPYDAEAEKAVFVSEMKTKLYLDESVELDFSSLLQGLLAKNPDDQTAEVYTTAGTDGFDLRYLDASGSEITREEALALADAADDAPQTEPTEPATTGNAALDQLLEQLKFDFSRLSEYEGNPNVLEIGDKTFAAVLQEALQIFGDRAAENHTPQGGIEDLLYKAVDYVSVGQVTISESDAVHLESVKMNITVKLEIRDFLKQNLGEALAAYIPNGALCTMASGLIRGLLPKTLYLGVEAFPYDPTKGLSVKINEMDQEKIEQVYSVVNGFAGDNFLETKLTAFNGKVVETVDKLDDKVPVSFVNTKCAVKPIQGMINMLKLGISESQFLYLVRDIELPTRESLGLDQYTETLRTENVELFIEDFTKKYGLDNSDGFLTPDNIFAKLSELQSEENLKRIHLDRIAYTPEYDAQAFKAVASYPALAGIINGYTAHSEQSQDIPATALNMSYEEAAQKLTLTAEIALGGMVEKSIGKNSPYLKLIKQIVPTSLFADAEMTLVDGTIASLALCVNKLSVEKTKEHFATISAVMEALGKGAAEGEQSPYEYDGMCEKLQSTVQNGFDKMTQVSDTPILFRTDCVLLPNVFETVAGLEQLKDENGVKDVGDGDTYALFKAMYKYAPGASNIAGSAELFAAELTNKFYIEEGVLDGSNGAKLFEDIKALKDTFQNDLSVERLAADQTPSEDLKAEISEEEFGYLIQSSGKLESVVKGMTDVRIIRTNITPTEMKMELSGKVVLEGEGAKFATLLPELIYIQMTVDVVGMQAMLDGVPEATNNFVSLDINNMTEQELACFIKITNRAGKAAFNKAEMEASLGRKLLATMTDLGNGDAITYLYADGKVVLEQTVFDLAIGQVYREADGSLSPDAPAAETFRSVLKKIHTLTVPRRGSLETADEQRAIAEINDKYYLNQPLYAFDPARPAGEGNHLLTTQLSALSRTYKTALDGAAMAADERIADGNVGTIADPNGIYDGLRPLITGAELGKILEHSFKIQASGIEKADVVALSVENSGTTMIVHCAVRPALAADAKYAALMPQSVILTLSVDLSKVSDPDAVCTSFTVNDMTTDDSAGKSELTVFSQAFVRLSGHAGFNVDEINADASGQIKRQITSVENGVPIVYAEQDLAGAEGEGGYVALGSVYAVAAVNLYKNAAETAPTERDFQTAVQELFGAIDLTGVGAETAVLSDKPSDRNVNVSISGAAAALTVQFSDRNMAAVLPLDKIAGALRLPNDAIAHKSVAFVEASASYFGTLETQYSNFRPDPSGSAGFGAGEYLLVAYDARTSAITGETTLLPDVVTVSFLLEISKSTQRSWLMFNNLSDRSLSVMRQLTKQDGGADAGIFADDALSGVTTQILDTEIFRSTVSSISIAYTIRDVIAKMTAENGKFIRWGAPTTGVDVPYAFGYLNLADTVTVF